MENFPIEVGIRVVRGPDWKWENQDGGEGHTGTIVEVGRAGSSSSPDKTVVVQWDMGSRTNYRVGYQNAFDLRIFDQAPTGLVWANVICNVCKEQITGMLWKCQRCFDFDLCTMCYMNDTHDLAHPFRRFDTATSVGVDLPPRQGSRKVVSKGIFAGARVVRGPDWDWSNQDGGEVGRVIDIRGWDHESGRSVANVIWGSGSTNVYRLGHKGKVDLKCVQASSAGSYYVNDLPVLGMPCSTINKNSGPSSSSKQLSSKTSFSFNVGDQVKISTQDIPKLKEMQEGHGGWNPRMQEFLGKVGKVHRITEKGDVRVQYGESGIRWTFNPLVVTKVLTYAIGDIVTVISDMQKVKELQKGHGEWVDAMKSIIDKRGTIIKVYSDNDVRINFGSSVWTMNPFAVKHVRPDGFEANNNMHNANAHRREESNTDPMSSVLPHLLDDMSSESTSTSIERFVREAAQGRTEAVKKMIPKLKDRLNHKSGGKTALQVAAHQGHLEIVAILLQTGAVNVEIADDDDGDTALHYSAFGNQPAIMDFLLKAGALVNAVNKGHCSALHVAVNKQFLDCVKILLKYKCNVNIQDSYGDTALHDCISKSESQEIIQALVNVNGVDFTLRNSRGFNVLQFASLKGNQYALSLLLLKSRQLGDRKKEDGFAPIHLAALNGHYFVVKALIEEGQVEIDIRNNRKQTALTLAAAQGHCGLVELLISKGAAVSTEDDNSDSILHTIIIKHLDNQGHHSGHSPVIGSELRKHDDAPQIAEIFSNLVSCGWPATNDETGAAAMACFLAQSGADINKKNRRGLTPLDLIRSDRLKEMLVYYSSQSRLRTLRISNANENNEIPGPSPVVGPSYGACAMPGVLSQPSVSLPKPECVLCSEMTLELVLFEPCGHRVVCEECCVRMKKCVTCQLPVARKVNQRGQTISSSSRNSLTSADRLRYLENKFAEIEETYCCSICMERRRNVAFLCGHGACERCADVLSTCHMCRTPIQKKINLY